MADIPSMSLKAVPMQFATFTPVQYTAQTSDPTLLAKSLQMQEAREKESKQNMDIIDTALANERDSLNVAEHDWLDKQANEIRKAIDEQINLGNYQSAIRLAQQSARDLKRNTDLQNKRAVNRLYQQERQRVQSMNIDPLTKRRWDAINQYSYNGTADWKPSWTPVNDVSLSNLQGLATQLTAEDVQAISSQNSNSNVVLVDENGEVTTDLTKAVGKRESTSTGTGSSKSTHTKTKEDIEKTFRALLADPNVSASLAQKYDTGIWAYEDAVARSNDSSLSKDERNRARIEAERYKKEITDENGFIISDYDTWVNKKIVPMFGNMEYTNTAISSNNSTSVDYSDSLFTRNITAANNKDALVTEQEVGVRGTQTQTNYLIPALNSGYKSYTPSLDPNSYGSLF